MKEYPTTHRELIAAFARAELSSICECGPSISEQAKVLRDWTRAYCETQGFEMPDVDFALYIVEDES